MTEHSLQPIVKKAGLCTIAGYIELRNVRTICSKQGDLDINQHATHALYFERTQAIGFYSLSSDSIRMLLKVVADKHIADPANKSRLAMYVDHHPFFEWKFQYGQFAPYIAFRLDNKWYINIPGYGYSKSISRKGLISRHSEGMRYIVVFLRKLSFEENRLFDYAIKKYEFKIAL